MYINVITSRGYECEYKNGKRIFSIEHRKNLSKVAIGNKNARRK